MHVQEYAEAHQLSQTDLDWLYCTRKSSAEARKRTEGAWISIAAALPHRKAKAVWSCGTRMLHLGNYKVRGGFVLLHATLELFKTFACCTWAITR